MVRFYTVPLASDHAYRLLKLVCVYMAQGHCWSSDCRHVWVRLVHPSHSHLLPQHTNSRASINERRNQCKLLLSRHNRNHGLHAYQVCFRWWGKHKKQPSSSQRQASQLIWLSDLQGLEERCLARLIYVAYPRSVLNIFMRLILLVPRLCSMRALAPISANPPPVEYTQTLLCCIKQTKLNSLWL